MPVQDFVLGMLVSGIGIAKVRSDVSHPLLQGHEVVSEFLVVESVRVVERQPRREVSLGEVRLSFSLIGQVEIEERQGFGWALGL